MDTKLKQIIEKIGKLKNKAINEAATKDYLIRPFFEYLGWDFSNPEEVVPEESDASGKRPDYSLYANGEQKILIEAKPLDAKLNDIKMINEKMGYCTNTQVPFLIITNGLLYDVYYSKLDGANKDKKLFDFELDENIDEDVLLRLKKEAVSKDELLNFAQNTFILTNVKKAMEKLLQDPPKKFISIITEKMKESAGYSFSDADIKNAMQYFDIQINLDILSEQPENTAVETKNEPKNWTIEHQFNDGKWEALFELYKKLINQLKKEGLSFDEKPTKMYIGLISKTDKKNFCQIHGQKKGLKAWVSLNINDLTEQEKLLVKDVSKVGHWGMGNIEVMINSIEDLGWVANIIKKAY